MSKTVTLIAVLAFAVGIAGAADAKPCVDKHGKVISCTVIGLKQCRNIQTKMLARCGAPNTEIIQPRH